MAVRLLTTRAGMLLLLALRRAAAAEPCALCMAAHPNHPFKWGRCMPPRDECSPPKGVELLVVRGTGNKWFAEDFLDQLRYFAHGTWTARAHSRRRGAGPRRGRRFLLIVTCARRRASSRFPLLDGSGRATSRF